MTENNLISRTLDVLDTEVIDYVLFFENYIGTEEIYQKFSQIDRTMQIESGYYLRYWVIPNYSFWLEYRQARRLLTEKDKRVELNSTSKRPIGISATLKLFKSSMPAELWNEYRRRILGDENLQPIFFELDTALHFWGMGFDIEWIEPSDISGVRIAEFIASTDSMTIEVECKSKSADSGRKILRKQFYRLIDDVAIDLVSDKLTGRISISVPDRLPSNENWKKQLIREITKCLDTGLDRIELVDGTIISQNLKRAEKILIPAPSPSNILDIQSSRKPHAHIAILAQANQETITNPLVFEVESRSEDKFIDSIFNEMGKAKHQLTGKHTAVISIFMPEVNTFESLGTNSALELIAKKFFQKQSNSHIFAVSFTSDLIENHTAPYIQLSSPSIGFYNPNYDKKLGPEFSIFDNKPQENKGD